MKQRSRSALLRGALLIALLSAALVGPTGAFALLQQIGNDASPASGHAGIVAQGVSFLPDGNAAWRIVQDTAEPLDVAVPETRALGFSVAVNDGILVNDYSYTTQTRVAAGEAAFVASGASQQRASISGGNAPYLRIGLVPASEASDNGGDTLVYAGSSFVSPDGRRDIDLLRDVLQEGEESVVGAGSAPSLVYVVTGSVTIDDGRSIVTLNAGDATEIDGAFNVVAEQDNSTFVAGIIGAQVPAMPRFSGTLTLDFRACPADVTRDDLEANAANGSNAGFSECAPIEDPYADGVRINLNMPDGERFRLQDAEATDEAGVFVMAPLAFGDYVLGRVTEFPEDYSDYLITDGNLGTVQRGNFTLDRTNLDVYRVIYLLQEPADTGSLTINYFYCDVASMDSWSTDACDPMEGPVGTEIVINDAPSQTLADADQVDTGVYTWSDLPVAETDSPASSEAGSYLIVFDTDQNTDLPNTVVQVDGADWIDAAGAYQVAITPSQPNPTVNYYLTNIDESAHSATLQVVGVTCADDASTDAECDANGEIQLPAVTVTVLEAGDVLNEATATLDGSTYVWDSLAFGLTWMLDASDVVTPAGYEVSHIVNTATGASGTDVSQMLDAATPTTTFRVYLVPAESTDDDADGLSNDDETNVYGTDPQNADSDADCFDDGSEVLVFGTDPLNGDDFPADTACNI